MISDGDAHPVIPPAARRSKGGWCSRADGRDCERARRDGGKRPCRWKIVAAATFGATLFLPIQAAVGIGVVLSALIYLNQKQLRRADGRLYLSGVDHTARELIERTGKVSAEAAGRIFEATPILGESTERARAAAGAWLITPSGR